MKKKTVPVNQALRKEVLSIIGQLFDNFGEIKRNRRDPYIAMPIIYTLHGFYADMNCDLTFVFTEVVEPYAEKLHENERLQLIKDLLTNGYIEINKKRITLEHLPYLNENADEERSENN
jgi:hypothetical protein